MGNDGHQKADFAMGVAFGVAAPFILRSFGEWPSATSSNVIMT